MPDFYKPGEYDLAGFAVGIVKQEERIEGKDIEAGDVLVGLASSGPHSNGFSLIGRIVKEEEWGISIDESGRSCRMLLTPTRIYVKRVLQLLGRISH